MGACVCVRVCVWGGGMSVWARACVSVVQTKPFIDCIIGARRSLSSALRPDGETPTIRAKC